MTTDQILTTADAYTDKYGGEYFDCYQIHILSFNQIFSTYFNSNNISIEQLKLNAENIVLEINKRSEKSDKAVLFQTSNGKFLIAENKHLFGDVELFVFEPEFVRYEACYDYEDFYDFLKETPVDTFFKNAFTTIGAIELYEIVESQINKLKATQNRVNSEYNKRRELDKTNPKYLIEVYKIEKNYIPVKVQEIKSNHYEITLDLPEHKYIVKNENRMAYIAKDIATNKVEESTIEDAIESIKYNKHIKRNPPIMDVSDLQRMELDNDDPNFLSYDNFTKNDDEYEEGDDEYIPR